MSRELLKTQLDLLKVIGSARTPYRTAILQHADKNLVHVLCEIIHNVLKGNLKIPQEDKEKLRKFRRTLYTLLKKSSLKSKRKILVQKGGFLQFLIPAVITGISSIISSVISAKSSQ